MRYLILIACLFVLSTHVNAQGLKVYQEVERMPEPGVDLSTYFAKNIQYPKKALDDNTEGTILTKFIVNEDGKLSDIMIVKSLSKECDDEARRVLKNMPQWQPGMEGKKAVKVYYTLPIVFKIPEAWK